MTKKYIVALDQGTTSSRAIVFDRAQNIVAVAQKEFPQLYPRAGWVEHDPIELYSCQVGVMMEAITRSGISAEEIAAVGITNQRETTVVWDKTTGQPIYNAIVWQCRRTADICGGLRALGLEQYIRTPPVWCSTPIFPRQRSNGSSTTSTAHGNAHGAASCCSARWTPG